MAYSLAFSRLFSYFSPILPITAFWALAWVAGIPSEVYLPLRLIFTMNGFMLVMVIGGILFWEICTFNRIRFFVTRAGQRSLALDPARIVGIEYLFAMPDGRHALFPRQLDLKGLMPSHPT